jgi:hypothetical protein
LGNDCIGFAEVRIAENFPSLGRLGLKIGVPGIVEFIDHIDASIKGGLSALKVVGDDRRDWETLLSVANGRCQYRLHGQCTKTLMELKPTVHGTGNGNRQVA